MFFGQTIKRTLDDLFFDIDIIVYPLSTKAPVKERLSNPYSSILG